MKKQIKDFFQSKTFRGILYGMAIVIILLGVFKAGVFVGYKKASFSFKMGDNYYQAFGPHPRGEMAKMMGSEPKFLAGAHGSSGKIISINLPEVIMETDDKVEKTILIDDKTDIRLFRDDVKSEELKVDARVVVIGSPNGDGKIEAKLIRILPST